KRASRADPRPLVDQPHSASFQFAEFRVDIADLDTKVMNSGAALGYKLSDRGFGASGFEQFNAAFADWQDCNAHALIFHDLDAVQFEAERVTPERKRLLN